MQKVEEGSAEDEDLTILSSYYILTKAQAPEYLSAFDSVKDTLIESEDTYSEAVEIMSDYYKNIQEKYGDKYVEKYFDKLGEVLEEEKQDR